MKVRTFMVGALVGGMALVIPATSAFASGDGLLGHTLGLRTLLGGNGCAEDEIVSVGGDAGVVGVNLAGDLDTSHLLGFSGSEDELLSVAGDNGIVGLGHGLETDNGLVGLNLASCDH
ncbi:MAG TPA: hypothetical protein VET24_16425 [Actinomycetota bacterium]|nr:hypothetical protein [Actinomycetota bacterium]